MTPEAAMLLLDAAIMECPTVTGKASFKAIRAAVAELAQENERLKTVMIAAAEEIAEHWEAHCDSEGYGPANLMTRLEHGMASEYGYTAGAFKKLHDERDALRRRVEELESEVNERMCKHSYFSGCPICDGGDGT